MKLAVARSVGIVSYVMSLGSLSLAQGIPSGKNQPPDSVPAAAVGSSAPQANATAPQASPSPTQSSQPTGTQVLPAPVASADTAQSAAHPSGNTEAQSTGPTAVFADPGKVSTKSDSASVSTANGGSAQTVPPAPTSRVTIVPYGYVKLGTSYDSARTAYGDLAFFVLPGSAKGGGKGELVFSARETRVGLKLAAPAFNGITPTGQIEADWFEEATTAGKYVPRLRLAFLDLALGAGWSIRAGQDWDVFVSVHPTVTDPGILGGTGHLYGRRPQFRITKVVKLNETDAVSFKVAAAHGRSQDVDTDAQIDAEAARFPTIQASLGFAAKLLGNKLTQLQVSGAYGREKLHLPVAKPIYEQTFESWLAHAALLLPLTDVFSLQGTVFWGKNLDQYLGGICQGINVASVRSIESVGGWGQLVAGLLPTLTATAGYGVDNPKDADISTGGRVFNSRAFGNLFIKVTPETTVALEYAYLRTLFASEGAQHGNRFAAGFQYSF
jgi:hypothetical protein